MTALEHQQETTAGEESADPRFKRPSVGIIGGQGRMGQWMAERLMGQGHQVRMIGRKEVADEVELVGDCQVLVLSVPAPAVEEVMRKVGPHTDPEGVIIDITSLKEGPLDSMLRHARGEVIGVHPLFGPGEESLTGQVVFLCPGRGRRWLPRLRRYLEEHGAQVVEILPDEHDQLMAQIQSLRHLMLYALGDALMSTGYDLKRQMPVSGPWFHGLLRILSLQCRQPAGLYADLALGNQHLPKVLAAFIDSLVSMYAKLKSGDREGLVEIMDRAGNLAGMMESPAEA